MERLAFINREKYGYRYCCPKELKNSNNEAIDSIDYYAVVRAEKKNQRSKDRMDIIFSLAINRRSARLDAPNVALG